MEATKLLEPLMKKVAFGDSVSRRAVTCVNAEQASKRLMQEPKGLVLPLKPGNAGGGKGP